MDLRYLEDPRRDRPGERLEQTELAQADDLQGLAYNKRVVDRLCQVVVISCRNKVGLDLQVDLEGLGGVLLVL